MLLLDMRGLSVWALAPSGIGTCAHRNTSTTSCKSPQPRNNPYTICWGSPPTSKVCVHKYTHNTFMCVHTNIYFSMRIFYIHILCMYIRQVYICIHIYSYIHVIVIYIYTRYMYNIYIYIHYINTFYIYTFHIYALYIYIYTYTSCMYIYIYMYMYSLTQDFGTISAGSTSRSCVCRDVFTMASFSLSPTSRVHALLPKSQSPNKANIEPDRRE